MEISFYTPEGNLQLGHGYSEVALRVVTSLQKLGHKIPFNSADSPVQINLGQPSYCADFYRKGSQHTIAYFPWESDQIPSDWYDCLEDADEVWTTSDWCFDVYKNLGLNVTNIYPHGIDHKWQPKKRVRGSKVRFLHHGGPAVRKGAQLAYDAFKEVFGDRTDVELILKASDHTDVRKKVFGAVRPVDDKNVTLRIGHCKEDQLISLYQMADVMVYPSLGEGWGLIPFQALGTGMPTICPSEWAHFRDYLGDLAIKTSPIDSPWKSMHPGKMLQPDFEDLCKKYQYAYDNLEELQKIHYGKSLDLHEEYDWLTVTENAVKQLVDKFS